MTSQYTKNQAKWEAYTKKLAKNGLLPPPEITRAYQVQSQYWNTFDTEAGDKLAQILKREL